LEGARQAFTAACARQPGMAEARVNLSTTLNQLGRYHEAESAALKAVELAPVNIDARLTLAAALRRLERPTEALQALLQARDIDGLDIRLYPQLAQLQTTLGQRDAARRAARRGVLINPSAKEAHVFLDEGQTAVNWA
ncbi:MAG: hypothetical protein O3B74_11615, partial [Proteobacteria bacterium]|nr:hypothetical protein [Pseudomonadota bacterium]